MCPMQESICSMRNDQSSADMTAKSLQVVLSRGRLPKDAKRHPLANNDCPFTNCPSCVLPRASPVGLNKEKCVKLKGSWSTKTKTMLWNPEERLPGNLTLGLRFIQEKAEKISWTFGVDILFDLFSLQLSYLRLVHRRKSRTRTPPWHLKGTIKSRTTGSLKFSILCVPVQIFG